MKQVAGMTLIFLLGLVFGLLFVVEEWSFCHEVIVNVLSAIGLFSVMFLSVWLTYKEERR